MKCAFPYKLRKEHYDAISGKIVPALEVPCGRCLNCRIEKSREWSLRCVCELPYWQKSIFVTLTYDEYHYSPSLAKRDLQLFFKRLRKRVYTPIKYYACGEYGSNTSRKHFHAIIFGVGISDEWNYELNCPYSENRVIEHSWTFGHVFVGSVSYHSCRYVADYIFKKYTGDKALEVYESKGLTVPFQMFSKGLGKRYFQDYADCMSKLGYISVNHRKYPLPKYYQELLKDAGIDNKKRIYEKKIEKYNNFLDSFELPTGFNKFDYDIYMSNMNRVLLDMNEKRQNLFAKGAL